MRRAPLVIAGTAAGLAAILLFHPRSSGLISGTIPPATPSAAGPTTSSGTSGGTSGPARSPGGSPGSSAGSSAAGSSGAAPATTYTGTAVTYSYGVLSVRVTVSGHEVTDVGIASITDGGNIRSQSIDQRAVPLLEQQALAAQSAHIQGVSGASYTSAGFARSLQSALAKAGL